MWPRGKIWKALLVTGTEVVDDGYRGTPTTDEPHGQHDLPLPRAYGEGRRKERLVCRREWHD